jgi:hypothetical protein
MATSRGKKTEEATTKLDTDVTKPSTTAPGDGPADTTDPNERAVSVPPTPGPEALATGTVNAVVPAPVTDEEDKGNTKKESRTEEFPVTMPDGSVRTVVRNVETGESTLK